MAATTKTKKPAPKAVPARSGAAKIQPAPKKKAAAKAGARPRPVRQAPEAISTLELRAILLVTLFVALCILFVQIYVRNS